MSLLKTSDKVRIGLVDGASVLVKPLNYGQKIELQKFSKVENGEVIQDIQSMMYFMVKHSVKGISGIKLAGDRELTVDYDDNGSLSDDSATDVLSLLVEQRALIAPLMEISGSSKFPDVKTEDGVEVILNPNE